MKSAVFGNLLVLPCPFCGGPSEVIESAGLFRAGCHHCAIWTDSWMDRDGAIVAWNKRKAWDHKRIGVELRERRLKAGLSCRMLARKMRCSAQYVADLEFGRRCWNREKVYWYLGAISPSQQ